MAEAKRCAACDNPMIGGGRARYCSAACKQRAHRSRSGSKRNNRNASERGDSVVVPGAYAALREQAQADWDNPEGWDPRWKRQQHAVSVGVGWYANAAYCGQPGVVCEHDPPPAEYRDRFDRVRLDQFEAGEPVTVPADDMPSGMLPPGDRARAYRVGPDDTVTIKT